VHFTVPRLVFVLQTWCLPPTTTNREEVADVLAHRADLAEQRTKWSDSSPPWVRGVFEDTAHEINESQAYCRHLYMVGLRNEGYTVTMQTYIPSGVDVVEESFEVWPPFHDVADISDPEAVGIQDLAKLGCPTLQQRLELKKYKLCAAFAEDAPAGLVVGVWDSWATRGNEARFWRISRERSMSVESVRDVERRGHTAYTASPQYHQREGLQLLLDELGMAHSHQPVKIDASRFEELLPRLQQIEAAVRGHLSLRPSKRANKGAIDRAGGLKLLKAVFKLWGVPVKKWEQLRPRVKGPRRPRVKGQKLPRVKRTRPTVYGILVGSASTAAFWDALSTRAH
jgi:hypothetical protein